MILKDLHCHTTYCDGQCSAAEMVRAAVDKGMECIGFSGHSYTFFDERYCMSLSGAEEYVREVRALREEYRGVIDVLCGVEQDYYSTQSTDPFDYVIGSVHYVRGADGSYNPVDDDPDTLMRGVEKCFGGDVYSFARAYFDTVGDVVRGTGADIIGHFDLVSKFNEGGALFDEGDPRYVSAWKDAVDRLLPFGVPFEINTGAVSRGLRTHPYPSRDIIGYIKQRGGRFVLSSDSHRASTLCFGFDEYEKYL